MARIIGAILALRRVGPLIVTVGVALWAISCAAPQTAVNRAGVPTSSANPLPGASSRANTASKAAGEARTDVITYTVQSGENLFSIADKFNLHPEVILWANEETLAANPHRIQPGVVLNILPVNGVYYRWKRWDTLSKVAERYNAKPEDILNWPGNHLDPQTLDIPPDALLVIPGGYLPITSTNGITIHTP